VNRELFARIAVAAAAAFCGTAALAKDPPKPLLSIEPISARNLLAPIDVASDKQPYRLDRALDRAEGQRARLSLEVGDTTVFALTGRLNRRAGTPGPLEPSDARALGLRRLDSKVYGAGVERFVNGVEIGATYQYSKATADQLIDDLGHEAGPGKSHSVRATARIRFRP